MPTLRPSCGGKDCTTWPSYGVQGTNKRLFCARHAGQDMVDLKSKICIHRGCRKQATFGVLGRTREFCAGHATEGTVCLRGQNRGLQKKSAPRSDSKNDANIAAAAATSSSKHSGSQPTWRARDGCRHPRCKTWPSFGIAGSKVREFCARHADEGMENVITAHRRGPAAASASVDSLSRHDNRWCACRGCAEAPAHVYRLDTSKTAKYCALHAPGGRINLTSRDPALRSDDTSGSPMQESAEVSVGDAGVANMKREGDDDAPRRGGDGKEQAFRATFFGEVGVFRGLMKKRKRKMVMGNEFMALFGSCG